MKRIQESFKETKSIVDFINESIDGSVNEGLRDMFKSISDKLKGIADKVVMFMNNVAAKFQHWYMLVNEMGETLPCSTPLTMGNAWKEGLIDKSSTFVGLGNAIGKIIGNVESFEKALNLPSYKMNANAYWDSIYEGKGNNADDMVNEVKMANQDPEAVYNVIVDDDELRKEIKFHMKQEMARLMIWGAPGIGKTAILMNVIKEISAEQKKDYSLIVKTLSNETPDNFFLPKYTESHDRSEDVPKTWLPVYRPTGDQKTDAQLDAACGYGMLFLDELSRATQQVQNVILPLINEGIMNGWKMASGWSIICASNRAEDEEGNGGQTTIGNALGNRFAQIYYEPTCKTWRKWADQQGFISPLLTQWLSMPETETLGGGKFFYWDPNEDADGLDPTHLMCTPRSWTNAMRDLACRHETGKLEGFNIFDIEENWVKRVLNKYVPAKAVDAFWAFLGTIHRIGNFDDAVESVWHNDGKTLQISPKDLIKVALPISQLVICAHKDALPTEKEFDSLVNWMVSSNNEQLASYVIDVFKNVYASNIPDNDTVLGLNDARSYVFVLKQLFIKRPDAWANVSFFKDFMNKWGYTAETMPDYSASFAKLGNKYKSAFKAAVVNGKEALG